MAGDPGDIGFGPDPVRQLNRQYGIKYEKCHIDDPLQVYSACMKAIINSAAEYGITLEELLEALKPCN